MVCGVVPHIRDSPVEDAAAARQLSMSLRHFFVGGFWANSVLLGLELPDEDRAGGIEGGIGGGVRRLKVSSYIGEVDIEAEVVNSDIGQGGHVQRGIAVARS